MVGSVTLIGWPEVDIDFWWRGRAEGPAEATLEPVEDMLLADISVRLLSLPFCKAAYRSVPLSHTYVFLLVMLPPEYTLLLGPAEDFFLSGPTKGLAVTSLFEPTVVLPSLRAVSLSHSSLCSLSTLLA